MGKWFRRKPKCRIRVPGGQTTFLSRAFAGLQPSFLFSDPYLSLLSFLFWRLGRSNLQSKQKHHHLKAFRDPSHEDGRGCFLVSLWWLHVVTHFSGSGLSLALVFHSLSQKTSRLSPQPWCLRQCFPESRLSLPCYSACPA